MFRWNLWPQVHRKHPSQLVLGMSSLGLPPLIEEVPQDEEGDDEAMEPGDLFPGAGVGFIKPTKRKLAEAPAIKRVLGKSAFSKGRRSSLIVKAASLTTRPCSSSRTGN